MHNFDSGWIPVIAIVLGILGIGLPTATFRMSQRWSESNRELSSSILTAWACLSIVSVLGAILIVLYVVGWMPPLETLLNRGVQRLLRCTDGAEIGLYSRTIPRFSGIKSKHLLENVMPPCSSRFPSVGAPTQLRRFPTIGNCSKSPQLS